MEYKIPLFDLNFGEEEVEAVVKTIRSNWISTGPKCEEFEKLFAEMFQVNYAVTVTNCTCALHLACIVSDIKEGDEVICPSLTFAASVNCIRYVGATPVFCDIKSNSDLNIDPVKLEDLITNRTKAIIVVHMAGFPASMDEIMNVAKKYNLKVIEDACHGPLSEYNGKKLGTIGDVGCFSFFSNKNISTGEGGMLVTNNREIAERVKLLRSHGMTSLSYQRAKGHATSYDIVDLGYNFRMDDMRAALGIVQLRQLPKDLNRRIEVRKQYLELLKDVDGIEVPFYNNQEYVSNYILPVVLTNSSKKKRDLVRELIHAEGIQTSIHYPCVHQFSIYKKENTFLPVTEYVSDNEITLPMYSKLKETEIVYIVNVLKNALNSVG